MSEELRVGMQFCPSTSPMLACDIYGGVMELDFDTKITTLLKIWILPYKNVKYFLPTKTLYQVEKFTNIF